MTHKEALKLARFNIRLYGFTDKEKTRIFEGVAKIYQTKNTKE